MIFKNGTRFNTISISGDSSQSPDLSPSKNLCGRLIPRPLATTSNLATFKFKSMVVTTSTGFKLTATVQRSE